MGGGDGVSFVGWGGGMGWKGGHGEGVSFVGWGGGMGWKGGHGEGEGGDDKGWVQMFRKWS